MSKHFFYRCRELLVHLFDNLLALMLMLLCSFVLLHSLPGNQVDALLNNDIGTQVSAQEYTRLSLELGLDKPLWQQFWEWLCRLSHGELGYSLQNKTPISQILTNALPWTLALVIPSLPLSLFLGALIGLVCGMMPESRISQLLLTLMTLLSSLPGFVVALLLLSLFAFTLGWFPTGGGNSLAARLSSSNRIGDLLWHIALPLSALVFHGCVRYFYLAYGLAQQISRRPFIHYAQLRGVTGFRLLYRWFLPNAMPELLSRLSSSLPGMIGAAVFIEVVFSYPGIGALMLDAIYNRDYELLQGILLLFGLLILISNSLLDLIISVLTVRG